MPREHSHYPVDVYVDSTGRYHLPPRQTPAFGEPTRYDFGDGVAGHGVTVWRTGYEDDRTVYARAYDALTTAGYAVREPRGWRRIIRS